MKKSMVSLAALLCCLFNVQAQFGEQLIISDDLDAPYQSYPVDLDNDSDIDIVTLFGGDYSIRWMKNLDGKGNFSDPLLINATQFVYLDIDFLDIDSDGDKDILFLGNNPRKLIWIENLDGLGNFGSEQLILEIDFITSYNTLDFDDDGDFDILFNTTDTFSGEIMWIENMDGLGSFGAPISLIDGIDVEFFEPILEDIDNDGDLDILTSLESYSPSIVVWYENSGNVSFDIEHVIHEFQTFVSDFTTIVDLKYVDVDLDGKKDVYFETYHDDFDNITGWCKALNEQGDFDFPEILDNLFMVFANYDLDDDGDVDFLSYTRLPEPLIFWRENLDGLGASFIQRQISTEIDRPIDVDAADFDGDGLLDVLSTSTDDSKVAWYKNTGILDVVENVAFSINMYPNPTSSIVYLNTNEPLASIVMYNVLGTKIKSFPTTSQFDISEVPSGLYFFNIKTVSGLVSTQKIIKK
ncbi:MAG TPA: T9SS type A sorting domain-containing protein [Flavobacteriaceae bacterium]|jgi:hypothetical protein|nr:T9SS type A sorting domain-containing protein [Flavobacteriaceae bacterium]HIN99802.1 T9SS type A sorting domain-containing protein [Flavobacteriaceae bacterium]|tara:strand:+ start:52188 stop:53588 length:1401 start_codon:yes stop_codon:yes gene_type:complete